MRKHGQTSNKIVDNKIAQKIRQRRRQIVVHSIIYYRFGQNIIPDYQFDKWCNELIQLQHEYPKISKRIELYDDFKDLSHASGFDLKSMNNPEFIYIAKKLIENSL
jgi:NAD-dependent DNA ligase (contains BRCT domain type II)